jgi:hypothetical protein
MSRRRKCRWNSVSTQNTYAFLSTVPAGDGGLPNTSRFHDPVTRPARMSAVVGFLRRPSSAGSSRIAARASAPSALEPNSMTSVRIFTKPLTVTIRRASSARQSPSSSASGGGTMPVIVATAAFSSARGTTASIASHASARLTVSPIR